MLDFHKGIAVLNKPVLEIEKTEPEFERFGLNFKRSDNGLYKSEKLYKGLFKLMFDQFGSIHVTNSVHKFAQEGFNVYDFPFKEMCDSLSDIYKPLGVKKLEEVKVYKPEFECAIQIQSPEQVYYSISSYRNKDYLPMATGRSIIYGKHYYTDYWGIKVYGKHKEMQYNRDQLKLFLKRYPEGEDYLKKTLRFELKITKNRYMKNSEVLCLKHLLDKNFIKRIYFDFTKKIRNSIFEITRHDLSTLSINEIKEIALVTHSNPIYGKILEKSHYNQYRYLRTKYKASPDHLGYVNELVGSLTSKINSLLE